MQRSVSGASKRVLMIAYHFPPAAGSSGIQRTLRFVQHLLRFGWQPTVLSAATCAYERTSEDLLAEVPAEIEVMRGAALDASRHLALAGRYPGFLARPDRWATWWLGGVCTGLLALRRQRYDLLWSTFPIATAHRIGASLQRRSGLPWVADFRDPMAQDGYPEEPALWRSYKRVEEMTVHRAARSVFTTPSALEHYRALYGPQVSAERFALIENGYDESSFADAAVPPAPLNPGKLTLLHSGTVYPSERDPTRLFDALAELRSRGLVNATGFSLRLRASEHDAIIRQLASERGVGDLIELLPPMPYRDAMIEMQAADALLLMQASNCNAQVPAKLYEYLRARRPILALTDPAGDTARVLRDSGVDLIAPLDDAASIGRLIRRFVDVQRRSAGAIGVASDEAIAAASRESRAAQLAALFDSVCAEGAAPRGAASVKR